jgi:hypothetical protein
VAGALAVVITVTNQYWVGGVTIYADSLVPGREQLHQAVLENRLPSGVDSWSAIGANSLNLRPFTVWAAEALHRLSGESIEKSYRILESAAMFGVCLLLFGFLHARFGAERAVLGLLYFGAVAPLTFFLHDFHPWDKPSISAWLVCLMLLTHRRWIPLGAALAVAMLVKFDIVLFPVLVPLAFLERTGWRRTTALTAALLCTTFGLYVLLRTALPGGEPQHIQIARNAGVFLEMGIAYPPLVALAFPAALAAIGFRTATRMDQAMVIFAVLQCGVLLLITNFEEFRAEVPLLLLLMPCALVGLGRVLGTAAASAYTR